MTDPIVELERFANGSIAIVIDGEVAFVARAHDGEAPPLWGPHARAAESWPPPGW